jgi:hypothetical protein
MFDGTRDLLDETEAITVTILKEFYNKHNRSINLSSKIIDPNDKIFIALNDFLQQHGSYYETMMTKIKLNELSCLYQSLYS